MAQERTQRPDNLAEVVLPEPFFELGEHFAIDLPGARAVFTTRRGGHSNPPYDSLNLGLLTDDNPTAVKANRASLEDQFGVRLAWRKQVHGAHVDTVDAPNSAVLPPDSMPPDGDGVATAGKGIAPLVLAADCIPIAITDGTAVAMVHAGWQGLAKGVIATGVAAVHAVGEPHRVHGGDPGGGHLVAAIGPAASVCCYEVSEELVERFAALGHGEHHQGRHLDLKAIAAQQLHEAGVETVHDIGICTICAEPGLLFSHRRDHGITGRQAGLAWLT
jgi:polyphenol oxidase